MVTRCGDAVTGSTVSSNSTGTCEDIGGHGTLTLGGGVVGVGGPVEQFRQPARERGGGPGEVQQGAEHGAAHHVGKIAGGQIHGPGAGQVRAGAPDLLLRHCGTDAGQRGHRGVRRRHGWAGHIPARPPAGA
jgi:hypothetical protein